MQNQDSKTRVNKQLKIMLLVVGGMFAFCFALVPLYSVFCKVTGLNGKTEPTAQKVVQDVDTSRTITVELLATLNQSLPDANSEFRTEKKKFTIHPGEYIHTSFWVKNRTPEGMIVQAIPSVSPGVAAKHFKKIECFCFQHQPLQANEGKDMTLVFTVSPDLPKHVHTVTLAYTLFKIS
jgi:cytochrome c oxidase assembly protein subunit 11